MELSNAMVVCIGIGTVFFGLVSIVILCYIMSAVCKTLVKDKPTVAADSSNAVTAPTSAAPIVNKQEIIAASCAVIAEELGTEANNIRVLSFKRI